MPLFGRSKTAKEVPLSDFSWGQIEQFINDQWISLAGAAWDGFNHSGKGFLFVNFESEVTEYMPASNPHVADKRNAQWDDVRKMMKKYDPKNEVVLMFHHFVPGNTTTLLRATPKGMPPPMEASQLMLRLRKYGTGDEPV